MLTNTEVLKAKPRSEAYRMTDGRGLYLTVTPTGGKLWRYKYRHAGKEKLMSLGQYPDVTLLEARELHAQARRVLATGVDPMAARKAEKAALEASDSRSFRTVALLWWEHWKVNKSPRHVATVKRQLENDVFPVLGGRQISEIEAPELVAMVKSVEARGVTDLSKRLLQKTGQVFRYAIAHSHCKRNPAADIKPGRCSQTNRQCQSRSHRSFGVPEVTERYRSLSREGANATRYEDNASNLPSHAGDGRW